MSFTEKILKIFRLGNVQTPLIDWSFVVYIDTGSPVSNIPSKSRGLADENKSF